MSKPLKPRGRCSSAASTRNYRAVSQLSTPPTTSEVAKKNPAASANAVVGGYSLWAIAEGRRCRHN